MKRFGLAVFALSVLLASPGRGGAGPITVDFNSVDTSAGPVFGPTVTNFLAGYGITVTDLVNSRQFPAIFSYGTAFISAPPQSEQNMFVYGQPASSSLTLDFATPLSSFTFTRVEEYANSSSGFSGSGFTISAFDSSNHLLSTASEGIPTLFQPTVLPAATYTLTGPGIKSVTVDTTFGESALYTNGWILNPETTPAAVPEPGGLAVLGIGLASLFAFGWMKKRQAKAAAA